jgi:hypothetical protein
MAKKRRRAPVHHVTGNLNVVEFTKAGSALNLEIFDSERKLGEITIGRGSFKWRGGNRRNYYLWSWTRFAELMNREAYGE